MDTVKNQDLLKLMDLMVNQMSEKDQNEFTYQLSREVGVTEIDPKYTYDHLRKVEKDNLIKFIRLLMSSKYRSDVTESFRRFMIEFKKEYQVN